MRPLRSTPPPPLWRRLGLCLSLLTVSATAQARVVDDAGWATAEAVEICQMMATAHHVTPPARAPGYGALAEIEGFAQQMLRRPARSERMDAASKAHYAALLAPLTPAQRSHLSDLFARLGDVGAVAPVAGQYDYIFIHGSTVPSMRRRVMALADAWGRGDIDLAPQGQVVFLDGERTLFASETVDVLLDTAPFARDPTFTPPASCPVNECEAAEMVWRQLQLPAAMRRHTPLFVHGAAQPGAARAQTRDVVHAWATRYHPKPGRALMVSENPYVDYQRLVTVRALRAQGIGVSVVAMGDAGALTASTSDLSLGIRLDNLAATLAEALALQNLDEHDIQPSVTP